MEFSSTKALSSRWGELPILDSSPFPDLDSPWKSSHNPFSPFPPKFEPQVIQPTQLQSTQWSSSSPASDTNSAASPTTSRTSTASSLSLNGTAGSTINEYRPRGSTGKRKNSIRRITPKSKKHAHELSRNRAAATKYRNRQKNHVDELQQKCKDVEMQREMKLSTVQSLRDELFGLRRELLRHTNCGDSHIREYGWNIGSSL